jgi:hypothetical protein
MAELDSFSEWFEFVHGEGGLKAGGVAAPTELAQFNSILQKKVLGMSTELSAGDATFLDSLVNLTARTIQYWIDRYGRPVPDTDQARHIIEQIRHSLVNIEEIDPGNERVVSQIAETEDMVEAPRLLVSALSNITSSHHSTRLNKELALPMEELARQLPAFILALAEYNEGLPIDKYLEDTFKNIQANYLLADS